jgi:hypothetical protein
MTQDDPVNGLDDGDTSPNAVIQGSGVVLRTERQGTGNGRAITRWATAASEEQHPIRRRLLVQIRHGGEQGTKQLADAGELVGVAGGEAGEGSTLSLPPGRGRACPHRG